MLEIGIDENLDQAIKNTLDKLPLLDNEQLGLSLNQIKQYIKNEEYWTYFEAGLQNFFNHQHDALIKKAAKRRLSITLKKGKILKEKLHFSFYAF